MSILSSIIFGSFLVVVTLPFPAYSEGWAGGFGLPPSGRHNIYQQDKSGHGTVGGGVGAHQLGAQKPMNLGTLPQFGGGGNGGSSGGGASRVGQPGAQPNLNIGGLPPLSAGLNVPGQHVPPQQPPLGQIGNVPPQQPQRGSALAESLKQFGGLSGAAGVSGGGGGGMGFGMQQQQQQMHQQQPSLNAGTQAAGRLDALMSQKLAGYQGEQVLPPGAKTVAQQAQQPPGSTQPTTSSCTNNNNQFQPPPMPQQNQLQPNTDPFLYLRDYFQRIVETSFSPQMQNWWLEFKSETGSSNMLQWKCREILMMIYEVRRNVLGEALLVRQDFEDLLQHRDPNHDSLNMFWAPGLIKRLVHAMTGALSFLSAIVHLRPECVPRVFKDHILLLIYNWDSMHTSAIMQQFFWNFHYHSFSFLLDHPEKPAQADIAYFASMLDHLQSMLERDMQGSMEAVGYFVEQKAVPEDQIKMIAIAELEKYSDNIDSEGKFTSYEVLYRNIFKRWFLDKGLVQGFLRMVAKEDFIGDSVIDLGAGGGHYAKLLNDTGLVTVKAYDAPVNLLPVDVDTEGELDNFTLGKVGYFDVAEEIPLLIHHPDGKIVKKEVVTAGIPTIREMRARTIANPTSSENPDPEAASLLSDETKFVEAFVSGKISTKVTSADFVLCVEVAEHVPVGLGTEVFVANLEHLGRKGMILSWAGEELCGLGWGHVNCLKSSVRELIEAKTNYQYDESGSEFLQGKSEISWIKKSVSFFRKDAVAGEVVDSNDPENLKQEAKSWFAYYQKIKNLRQTTPPPQPKEESKHQKDRAKFVKKIITAPILELKFSGSSLTKDKVIGEGQYGPNILGREEKMAQALQTSAARTAHQQQQRHQQQQGQQHGQQQGQQAGQVGVGVPIQHQAPAPKGIATPVDLRFVASGKPMGLGGNANAGGNAGGGALPPHMQQGVSGSGGGGPQPAGPTFKPGSLPSSGPQLGNNIATNSVVQPGRVFGGGGQQPGQQQPGSMHQHQHGGAPPQQPQFHQAQQQQMQQQMQHQQQPQIPPGPPGGTDMAERISGTMDNTRDLINKGVAELNRINAMHRANRPTDEPEPDLLNYEKVFAAVEADYGDKTIGLGLH